MPTYPASRPLGYGEGPVERTYAPIRSGRGALPVAQTILYIDQGDGGIRRMIKPIVIAVATATLLVAIPATDDVPPSGGEAILGLT